MRQCRCIVLPQLEMERSVPPFSSVCARARFPRRRYYSHFSSRVMKIVASYSLGVSHLSTSLLAVLWPILTSSWEADA